MTISTSRTKLNVNTLQVLQQAIVLSRQLIVFNFQSSSQLWNISNQNLINIETNKNVIQRIAVIPGGQTSVVYVRYNLNQDIRQVFRFNFEQNVEVKLGQFSKQGSINKIFIYDNQNIRLLVNLHQKKSSKLFSLNPQLKQIVFNSFVSATLLNNQGSIIVYETHLNGNKFWLVNNECDQQFSIPLSQNEVISNIKSLPNSRIIITTHCPNHKNKCILKTWSIDQLVDDVYTCDNIVIANSYCMKTNKIISTSLSLNQQNTKFENEFELDGEIYFSNEFLYLNIKKIPNQMSLEMERLQYQKSE